MKKKLAIWSFSLFFPIALLAQEENEEIVTEGTIGEPISVERINKDLHKELNSRERGLLEKSGGDNIFNINRSTNQVEMDKIDVSTGTLDVLTITTGTVSFGGVSFRFVPW